MTITNNTQTLPLRQVYVVDAIDDEAREFYEAYELRSIPTTNHLLLPMATVERLYIAHRRDREYGQCVIRPPWL